MTPYGLNYHFSGRSHACLQFASTLSPHIDICKKPNPQNDKHLKNDKIILIHFQETNMPRNFSVVVALFCLVLFGCTAIGKTTRKEDASAKGLSRSADQELLGTWVSQTDTGSGFSVTFSAGGTMKMSTRFEEHLGTYQADFSKTPIHIDMDLGQNDRVKTILKLVGDERLIIANNNPGEPRPQSFSSKAIEFTRSIESASSQSAADMDSASEYVVIDQSEPAFIVFTGIPKGIDPKQLEEIQRKVSDRETLTMVPWSQFVEQLDEYARLVILRKDYPNIRTMAGIACLVASKQGAGAPWGLTWNGGIALTFNDYQHARRTYESYKAAPASYQPIRDPRRDPVHPSGHLPFGGCY
jgi:hypothetical protein